MSRLFVLLGAGLFALLLILALMAGAHEMAEGLAKSAAYWPGDR